MTDRSAEVTPELPRASTARRAALFVVGIVVCFLIVNAAARWYLQHNGTNFGYRIVHAKWTLVEELDAPAEWLVLGDSAGTHGVMPAVLAEELGGPAVNLATLANLLVAEDAWMLQRYIENVGPPKNVLVMHAYDVWHRGYKSALIGKIPLAWGFWERYQPPLDIAAEHQRKIFLSRYLPLYAERDTLRTHIARRGEPPKWWRFEMSPDGFIPAFDHWPTSFAKDIQRVRRFLGRTPRFKVSPPNRAGLEALGKLAGEHGFDVYLVNGPMHRETARRDDFQRYQRQKQARLRAIAAPYPRLHVVDHLETFSARQMETCVDHVIPSVAPRFTRATARAVRAAMSKR